MLFITVDGIVNLTSDFDYVADTVGWDYEILQVWVDNVNEPTFTYDIKTKTLSVPGTTGGETVKARFRLYLISGGTSVYAPSDPTNSLSAKRVWVNGVARAPTITRSIDNLDLGYSTTKASRLELNLSTSSQLLRSTVYFDLQKVRIYKDSVLLSLVDIVSYSKSSTISLNLQKPNIDLTQLATFGDPDALVRVDPTHSTYYTGSSVPEQYHGQPIPMIFGSSTPYTRDLILAAESGVVIGAPLVPPIEGPIGFTSVSSIIKPIPIGARELLIGRMPSYQSLTDSSTIATPFQAGRTLSRIASYTSPPADSFVGERVQLTNESPFRTTLATLINDGDYAMDDSYSTPGDHFLKVEYRKNIRVVLTNTTRSVNPRPTLDISTITPGGHRLIKLTFSPSSDPIDIDTPIIILQNITGARSGPNVLKYILESHGIVVSSADFTAADTAVSDIVNLIIGADGVVPKVSDIVSRINTSVFASLYTEKNSTTQRYKIYSSSASTATLTSDEVTAPEIESDSRDIQNKIYFKSKYVTQEDLQGTVNVIKTSSNASDVINTPSQTERGHVFETNASRLSDIMTFYGTTQLEVSFTLLDEDIALELADTITLSTYVFSGDIFITEIQDLELGRKIKGRVLPI